MRVKYNDVPDSRGSLMILAVQHVHQTARPGHEQKTLEAVD
jgi:hypothetical protein